jgi:hypothetical protein
MDHYREIKNSLTWHGEGRFEVEVTNGVITKLNFCEPGKGPEVSGKCLTSTNFKFLQAVYSCLGDLFAFIQEENKRLGYSYAQDVEISQQQEDETMEGGYPMAAETRLRPLINYDHKKESNKPSPGESEPIRDIG